MKVINFKDNCRISNGEEVIRTFKKDNIYILSNAFFEQLKTLFPHVLGLEISFKEVYNQYRGQDLNNKRIIMLRHGGGGDLLFMLTAIRELKQKFPDAEVSVAIGELYAAIVKDEPVIDKIFCLPISLDDWNNYHYHLIFEGLIEKNVEANNSNAYDLFMKSMFLDPEKILPENKIPRISLSDLERFSIKKKFPSLNSPKKKVGIQAMSSSPIRNYPIHNFISIVEFLIERGYDVYFLGSGMQEDTIKGLVKQIGIGSFNGVNEDLRESIILADFMDFIIAPDSMFIHIGAALGKPVLGIYGPFSSELRMKYFKNSVGIDVEVGCSPCFQHGKFPCSKGSPSPCFSVVTPGVVIEAFKKLEEENSLEEKI